MRLFLALLLAVTSPAFAQQAADPAADVSVPNPTFPAGSGPVVAIDAAHRNFHTADGRYAPVAALLRNDGYKVVANAAAITAEALVSVDVLVIANAASAVTSPEVAAVKAWVGKGGALLLIADHMPFPAAVDELASAFGFRFENAFALQPNMQDPEIFSTEAGDLAANEMSQGRGASAPVTKIRTFAGSSFRAPAEAVPILKLGRRWNVLRPEQPWVFTPQTPARPATSEDLRAAALQLGRGRIVVVGEAAMFSAQVAANGEKVGFTSPGAEQNKQFLLNLVHWLGAAN
jgi:hypothetical protein